MVIFNLLTGKWINERIGMSVMNSGYVMLLNYDWVVYPSLALLTDEKALTKGLNND